MCYDFQAFPALEDLSVSIESLYPYTDWRLECFDVGFVPILLQHDFSALKSVEIKGAVISCDNVLAFRRNLRFRTLFLRNGHVANGKPGLSAHERVKEVAGPEDVHADAATER